jgi:hypothetical protein
MELTEKRYLGNLCKNNHDFQNTGKSLRTISGRCCCVCNSLIPRNSHISDKYYLGKLCPLGHEHERTGQSLLRTSSRHCLECEKSDICKARKTLANIKRRAKASGVPVSIDADWIVSSTPKICPILYIPLERGAENTDNSPSVDRLIPELGYTPENCRVISQRANRVKSNGTIEEHRRIADWIEKELNKPISAN